MAKIRFINSRKDAHWSFTLKDGRIIEVLPFGENAQFIIRFDTPFNLETLEIGEQPPYKPHPNKEGLPDDAPEGFTTLNNLIAQKLGKQTFCYDEFEIMLGRPKTLSAQRVARICNKFKKNGFNVTPQAILHNWDAWLGDLKSGYRDEKNGYHLFSPCGCNDLRFSASTIDNRLDWQTTYKC